MKYKINNLVTKLIEYRDSYYKGTPIISDDEFDLLEDELRKLDPNNSYFDIVGSNNDVGDINIYHNFSMLSMDKIKYPKPIYPWYNRIKIVENEELVITPKIDGCSCTLVYDCGKFIYAATRGNGLIGKLITFGEKYNIVKPLPLNGIVEIRGELYIPKKYGDTIFKNLPLRNQAAGIIRSGENTQYLDFVAYQMFFDNIENVFKKESDILNYLKQLKFNTVQYSIVNNFINLNKEIQSYITTKRNLYDYETDGLVITVNDKILQKEINNKKKIRSFYYHNIAYKPPSKVAKSKLLDVEINISKSGRLIPVMIYEPVIIDNVEFERVTLNNYEYLKSAGKLYVGNTIYLMRGNDVIIVFLRMDEDGNKNIPIIIPEKNCPVCKTELIQDGKHKVCPNRNCPGRTISIIYNWIVKRNMKNIGIKFLELAYEKGFIRSILDLYDPDLESKIETLERFIPGGGKINKIMSAINKSKVDVSDIDILSSIGIPGIGRATLENIKITNINTLPSDILGKGNYTITNNMKVVPKENKQTSDLAVYRYIAEWITTPGNYSNLVKLKKILNSKSNNFNNNGKSVVITGSFSIPRNDIKKLLIKKGYKISDNVSKKTDYLIVGQDAEKHNKFKEAKKFNIKMVDINELQ